MLESIKRLKHYVQNSVKLHTMHKIFELIDEVEREIMERYMPRPIDADGIGWRTDDEEFIDEEGCKRRIHAYKYDKAISRWKIVSDARLYQADKCHHIKSRAVEDVLRDVWNEALDYAKSDMWRNPSEVFAERADEIRELLGSDS